MITIQNATKSFLHHCKYEKNLSTKTLKFYSIDLRQFSSSITNKEINLINKVTKLEVRNFLETISNLKPKSIKRKIATVKALFNFLEFDDQIVTNPLRKMKIRIKEPMILPVVMDLSEIKKILLILYKKKHIQNNIISYSYKESIRNIVIIELLFATGGRVSEIARLKDIDININSGVIIIQGKGSKERIIQVCNEETLSLLRYYRKIWDAQIIESNHYFLVNRLGKGLSEQSIRNLVKKVSKEAGITKHITPHVFRHSFATLLLEKDVDIKYIQSLLGHSSINTTQIYTHVNKSKQRQLLKAKHPRKDISIGNPTL